MGEYSRSTSTPTTIWKSQSMRHSNQSPLVAHSLYKSFVARQKNIKDIFKGGAIKETMRRLINKFFIYENVAPAKAKSHHFKNMIIGAQQAGNTNFWIVILFHTFSKYSLLWHVLHIFLYMKCRNGNRTSIFIWNKEQVLRNGVQRNGSLCEPAKRKMEDIWVHNNVRLMDRSHEIKYY